LHHYPVNLISSHEGAAADAALSSTKAEDEIENHEWREISDIIRMKNLRGYQVAGKAFRQDVP
jgi:hypothetical protein